MILSSEYTLNISHLVTQKIKNVLVSALEKKVEHVCTSCTLNTLFIFWKNEDDTQIIGKKASWDIWSDMTKPLWAYDIIKDLCWVIYHITIGILLVQTMQAWFYVKSYSSYAFSFVTLNLV